MPLINNFRSTNIWKAFVLNSLVASIVIVIGITVKSHFDTYTIKDDDKGKIKINGNIKYKQNSIWWNV